ncbi:hypothetical protein K440DRAFT_630422 [Wilcoxina mikolae CBS 423.85]|nr:hypothetical protein K440DRAFT_630422 [Wilcoxina mikolae CBS 423.85]
MAATQPLTLSQALSICSLGTASAQNTALILTPIRCIHFTSSTRTFTLHRFSPGQKYYAISYTWPSANWSRIGNSNNQTEILHDISETGITQRQPQYDSVHFSGFAARVTSSLENNNDVLVWVDHECIHQENADEQRAQVAVMDSIYLNAVATVVLLEDIALSTEEYQFLRKNTPRKRGEEVKRHTEIVRRILGARWFTRAWCSQEMLLSRHTMMFVHCTDDDETPIWFPMHALVGWMSLAMIQDPTIQRLSMPRGSNQFRKSSDSIGMNTTAWAFGVVHPLGCWDPFDKIHLVLNLVRVAVEERLVNIPTAGGSDSQIPNDNVLKVMNTYAALNGDFSLWLTNHVPRSAFQSDDGFGWGGIASKGDLVSEGWVRKDYCLDRDPEPVIDNNGILLRGVLGRVQSVQAWEIWRDVDKNLHARVNGTEKLLAADWLESQSLQTEKYLRPLIDICYAIEAFNAREIYPYFLPAQGDENWIDYEVFTEEDLKTDMHLHFDFLSGAHTILEAALRFMQYDGIVRFKVVELEGSSGLPLVMQGNVEDFLGRVVFQPYVIRPKVFASNILMVNSMVLQQEGERWKCVGGVRGFGLIPESGGEVQVKVF